MCPCLVFIVAMVCELFTDTHTQTDYNSACAQLPFQCVKSVRDLGVLDISSVTLIDKRRSSH